MELAIISGVDGFNHTLDYYMRILQAEDSTTNRIADIIPVRASLYEPWRIDFRFEIDRSPVVPGQEVMPLVIFGPLTRETYFLTDGIHYVGLVPTSSRFYMAERPQYKIGKNEISEFLEARLT